MSNPKKPPTAPPEPVAPPPAPAVTPPLEGTAPRPNAEVTGEPKPVIEMMLAIGRARDGRFRVALIETDGTKPLKPDTKGWGSMRQALAEISRALPKLQDFMRKRLPAGTREGEVTRG